MSELLGETSCQQSGEASKVSFLDLTEALLWISIGLLIFACVGSFQRRPGRLRHRERPKAPQLEGLDPFENRG